MTVVQGSKAMSNSDLRILSGDAEFLWPQAAEHYVLPGDLYVVPFWLWRVFLLDKDCNTLP